MSSTIVKKQHLDPYPRLSPSHLRVELSGKTVLITGGGYGIGAAIASSFAGANVASIVIAGRTESKLAATVSSLQKEFSSIAISYKTVDISSAPSVKAMFASLTSPIDILVNNAGFLPEPANFASADLTEWWKGFETNVLGSALVTQAFLQHRKAGSVSTTGVVLNLNTIGAYSVMVPNLSAYGASKAALLRMNELISADISATEARFISVHPGAVKTDMGAKSGLEGAFPETDARLAADFVVWASSEEAAFLAGRFAWVNWDVGELVAKKRAILDGDLLKSSIKE